MDSAPSCSRSNPQHRLFWVQSSTCHNAIDATSHINNAHIGLLMGEEHRLVCTQFVQYARSPTKVLQYRNSIICTFRTELKCSIDTKDPVSKELSEQ